MTSVLSNHSTPRFSNGARASSPASVTRQPAKPRTPSFDSPLSLAQALVGDLCLGQVKVLQVIQACADVPIPRPRCLSDSGPSS